MAHPTEKSILLKLIHTPEAGYNELWNKEGESNAFAYHIKKLEEQGLVFKKENGRYSLTQEGKKQSAFVEGDTGEKAAFPTMTVLMLVKKNNQFLCHLRLKEPFYGYWGFPAGKINFGQNLYDCATRDLQEEAGLIAKEWTLKALEQVKTYNEHNELIFHHYIFHVFTEQFTGELKTQTHKARNEWLTLDEYKQKNIFPSEKFFKYIIPATTPVLIEADRFMKDGKFTDMKLTKVEVLGTKS